MSAEHFDLIVVGAGPAGSAAALAALRDRPDARVLLLDRSPLGRDKVCGDGIAPHAVAELDALGVSAVDPDEIVPAVRLVSPSGGGRSALTQSPGYVVPRRTFDERLARAAIAAGAHFRQERVTTLTQNSREVTVNGRLTAPVVVAADGANSVVRRLVGEPANRGRALAVALRGYAPTPPGHAHELLLRWDIQRQGGLCYAWAFPTRDGVSNIGYGMSAAGLSRVSGSGRQHLTSRLRALLGEFDLTGVDLVGHTLPLTIQRPRAAVGRVLLTGDAASLINPFTGEGIFTALASGALAGRVAVSDSAAVSGSAAVSDRVAVSGSAATHADTPAARYTRQLRQRFGRQHRQSALLYPLLESRRVLDAVIRACGADIRTFDRLLDVGLGDSSFAPRDLLRLVGTRRPDGERMPRG
ncbi:geranylgeranyl reductase family protein [Glaciihabitans tibetensis]|uniref:Geranylgeranyl reductase family protein n=1 Tax=Glaciihabitans tibetensis TaxID=1266600 RepID=A0A2T0VAJ3_9MICO|nr:geranylgeranyl reductase family protein [Glaciihabitans tibetensis]PRY67219.1 geranylgeranyl reductase family protein [Glaciihabitans tibetensis]